MKVLIRQFLGKNHSWSCFGWGMARALSSNHDVHLFATDGIQNLPPDLKSNIIGYTEENSPELIGRLPDSNYDMQISYTAMKNFPFYLSNGNKNRFGVWCYEWAGKHILPTGFAKHFNSCDFVCPPSQFSKQIFLDSNIPENKIKVIPHGIDANQYNQNTTITLPTNKKYKILANIAQNHLRKNIPGLLEAYGKAFTNKDDVCLIIKGKDKPVQQPFDVSLKNNLNNFYQKYPQHAEIKIYSNFLEDISALYRSVDAVFSMTHCEGFFFPGLESIASGKLVIAPNWGGQLDFLNTDNALLIEGKEERADPKSMYWESKNNAIWFNPDVSDAVEKLRYSYNNFEKINEKIQNNKTQILQEYSWENVASQFLKLCHA